MKLIKSKTIKLKTKRVFLKKGTCSRTFFYLLNREFGNNLDEEERAIDLLAGGILQQGYQCGMLWGASMAVGTESFRRNNHPSRAIATAITATQQIMESFKNRTNCIECEEITSCKWSNKFSIAKYFFTGKFYDCFNLAGKWAPEAIQAAIEGLSDEQNEIDKMPVSCASEVIKMMGGSEKEMIMVAGFAGGLGLSGNGCGALAAAIWMNALIRIRKKTMKTALSDPVAEKILNVFLEKTSYEMECSKICERKFKTIDEHSEFIKNGGCRELINTLADHSSIK